MTVKQVLFNYLDSLPESFVYGLHLQAKINSITGKKTFASTILSYVREYADISGSDFICVSRQESKYHFVPGIKISGCLGYNKE